MLMSGTVSSSGREAGSEGTLYTASHWADSSGDGRVCPGGPEDDREQGGGGGGGPGGGGGAPGDVEVGTWPCLGTGVGGEHPFDAIFDAKFPIFSELLPPKAVTDSLNL